MKDGLNDHGDSGGGARNHVLLLHFDLLGMTLLGVELGPQAMDLLCELGALVHHTSLLLAADCHKRSRLNLVPRLLSNHAREWIELAYIFSK